MLLFIGIKAAKLLYLVGQIALVVYIHETGHGLRPIGGSVKR